jgi:hypothetical protein
MNRIARLFEQVGNDYPNEMHMTFNPHTQDYDVTATMHTGGNWASAVNMSLARG